MKKMIPLLALSLIAFVAGVLLKPVSKLLCGALTFGGLMLLLMVLGYLALTKTAKRCPVCGQLIHVSPGQYNRVRTGMIACPRCGVLVRVDHVTRR